MTRIVKKTVSAVMSLVMTVGILITGDSGILHAQAADTTHINNKYIKEIGNGEYSTGVAYGDGIILLSNVTDSTYSGKNNVGTKVSLSSDSKLTFVDKDGIDHVLNNKDENGNKKFDAIYGLITQTYYKYNIVEKNSKLGAIDNYGKQITLNGKEWYDNIYVYDSVDNGKFYGLVQNKSEEIFDFTLMGEDGNVVYTMKDCTNVKDIVSMLYLNNQWDVHSYFILFDKADGNSVLVDFEGNVWNNGGHCTKVIRMNYSSDKRILLEYDDSYGYYNYTTGEKLEKKGKISEKSNHSGYFAIYDGTTIEYDSNMKKVGEIEGEVYNISTASITGKGKGSYVLKNSKYQIINVCGKDGKMWFGDNGKISFDKNITNIQFQGISAEGAIVHLSGGQSYYVTDGAEDKYDLKDLVELAYDAIKDNVGDIQTRGTKYYLMDSGIIISYKGADKEYAAAITKESGYKEAVYIGNGINDSISTRGTDRYGNSFYIGILIQSEPINKQITLKDGNVITTTSKIKALYDRCSDIFKAMDTPEELYRASGDSYLFSDTGEKYEITTSGFKKITYDGLTSEDNKPYIFNVGKTGTYFYQSMKDNRYRVYDKNDNEIDIGLDKIYDGNNTNIYLSRGDLDGYFTLGYYNKDNQKTYKKLYTYKGEYIMDYSTYGYDQCIRPYYGLAGEIYFIDNRAVRVKKIDFGILNDSELKEDSTIKIGTIKGTEEKAFSGLKENSTIEDIRKELPKLDITVVDSEGNELAASKPVGTGCRIQAISNGNVVDTATVVIKGDTDGSGTIDVLDMEAVQKSILGIGEGLAGAYNEAAKLTGNDTVSVLDMEAIQKNILGLEKIN